MGRTYIRTLDDVDKKGLVLKAVCECGHIGWLGARWLYGKKLGGKKITRWYTPEEAAPVLRCRVCKRRGPKLMALHHQETGAPAGVPLLPFLQADDRERKRMIRQARG